MRFPFIDTLLLLKVKPGTTYMSSAAKKLERISLLHPQDTRALDVVEVSLSSFRNKGHTIGTLLGSVERLRFVFIHFNSPSRVERNLRLSLR